MSKSMSQTRDGMREALEWALDEIDVLSNRLIQWAYPQGIAMLGREDQFEKYKAARAALSTKQEGEGSAAAAAPLPDAAEVLAALEAARRIVAWDDAGKLVDDESEVQNLAPSVARTLLAFWAWRLRHSEAPAAFDARHTSPGAHNLGWTKEGLAFLEWQSCGACDDRYRCFANGRVCALKQQKIEETGEACAT